MPVTKLDKRNASAANFDVIVFFPIYGQFGVIWMPDLEWMGSGIPELGIMTS